MNKIYLNPEQLQRLQKLCTFLDHLEANKFDFQTVWNGKRMPCDTVCCALGWCCTLFPEFNLSLLSGCSVQLNTGEAPKIIHYENIGEMIFGIPARICRYIFIPADPEEKLQISLPPDLRLCGDKATPTEVAHMLRQFIRLCVTEVQPEPASIIESHV